MFDSRLIVALVLYNFYSIQGEELLETYCDINGKYPLHHISENFLSISVDPAALSTELNLSDTSLLLAKHLSPAYIRITGGSTQLVQHSENEDEGENSSSGDGNNVVLTPSMWFGINEWLKLANLTPVFGINDVETARGAGSPKSTLPLSAISDKLNVSCYWMLGFDSSKKNKTRYKEDIRIFQDVLAAFPKQNNIRSIVGTNGNTQCVFNDFKDIVTAVTWELNSNEKSLPIKESSLKATKTPVKFWTVSPKPEPTSFSSTILWAEQVGNAAKAGYDVVFRQPKLNDIFWDAPAYWFSLLHKKLIGKSVIEVKPLTHHTGSSVFAHCTKEQDDFKGRGALTVMVVNNNPQSYKVKIKLESIPWSRFIEVHSYILTSPNINSTDIFLNGEKLIPEVLLEKKPFQPNTSIRKSKAYVSLRVPPISIGFFVLPRAKVPACISEEKERNAFSEKTDTVESLFDSMPLKLQPKDSFNKNLYPERLTQRKEFQVKKNHHIPLKLKLNVLKQKIESDIAENPINLDEAELEDDHEEYMKLIKKKDELREKFFGKRKKQKIEINPRSRYLDLTSEETERILKDRARSRAAQKKVFLTEDELDIIVEAVRRKFLKPKVSSDMQMWKNDVIKTEASEEQVERSHRKPRDVNMKLLDLRAKLEENRQRLEDRMSNVVGNAQTLKQNIRDRIRKMKQKNYRFKRDINMKLLKLKIDEQTERAKKLMKKTQNVYKDKRKRKSEKSSDDLSESSDERDSSVEKVIPSRDFFTESANSEESRQESTDSLENNRKPKKLGLLDRIKKLSTVKSNKDVSRTKSFKDESEEVENSLAFLTASDELNDIGGELPCISEYFGSPRKKSKSNKRKGKLFELSKNKGDDSLEYLRKKRSVGTYENVEEFGEVENYVSKASTDFDEFDLDLNQKNFDKRNVADCLDNYRDQFENGQYERLTRIRRNSEDIAQDIQPDNKNTPIRRIDLRQRLKDLLQNRELKIDKDTLKSRLKLHLLDNMKIPDQVQMQSVGDKKEEIHEKLKSIREKITVRLKDINKLMTSSPKPETNAKVKQNAGQNTIASTASINSGNIIDTIRENNQASAPVNVAKRSIFDQDRYDFGNYKPITPDLRAWKPSDILSLKGDYPDSSQKLVPISDFLVFRNVIIPNKSSESRRKRNSLDYLDKDSYMNDIEKESLYIAPKIAVEEKDHKVNIAPQENDQWKSSPSDIKSERKQETPTSAEAVEIRTRFNENINGTKDEFPLTDNITVTNRVSDNIQKIPSKEEQHTIDSFINKISGFFTNIGLALRHYL